MIKKMTIALVITVVIIALGSFFLKTYYIGHGADAELLWDSDQAYIVVNVNSLGWRMSYLQYLMTALRESARVASPPNDRLCSSVMLRVTAEGTQRYEMKDHCPATYVGYGSEIYGNDRGVLLKWVDGHLEQLSPEKQKNINSELLSDTTEFDHVKGWSKRHGILTRLSDEVKFDVEISGQPLTFSVNRGSSGQGSSGQGLTINLVRANRVPETMWHLDQHPRKVTKDEYENVFGGR